jgi:hypothetical protein
VTVPERPDEFFTDFLPRQFAEFAAAADAAPGRAPGAPPGAPAEARVLVRVAGAGEWSIGITARALSVRPGPDEAVALQLSLRDRDFVRLVVEPAQRGLARRLEQPDLPQRAGLWSRLSRWDRETTDLLRQQPAGLLVRIEDQGTVRPVAVTPGTQPYSLDAAACIIECRLSDLVEIESGKTNPIDVFYSGRLRITGDAQIALALAGLFI